MIRLMDWNRLSKHFEIMPSSLSYAPCIKSMAFRCKPALKTECRNCSPQRKVNVVLFDGPSPIFSSPLGCKVDGPDSERRMEYESEHVVQAEHVNVRIVSSAKEQSQWNFTCHSCGHGGRRFHSLMTTLRRAKVRDSRNQKARLHCFYKVW